MTTAVDVARYIQSKVSVSGEVQLHKLVYYAQGWHLAWDGRPLFDGDFEAWPMGPVNTDVRVYFNWGDVSMLRSDLSADEAATVDAVVDYYGKHYGSGLSALTHKEEPWKEAREGLAPNAHSARDISRTTMRRFYTTQSIRGEGPKRRSVMADADTDVVMQAARMQAKEWHEALMILADR